MLELVGVVVTDGRITRLNRCGFECRAGEVLGLAGGSGAGKSTALAVAAGARAPDRGRVLFEGRDVTKRSGRLRAAVSLVGAHLPGPRDLSVRRWLGLWAELDGVPRGERVARIAAESERFGVAHGDRAVLTLSRGERARLSLARAWVRRPSVYLLDAPGAALDGDGLRRLTRAIRAVSDEGRAVVIADAAPHLLTTACERVVLLADGAVTDEVARTTEGFAKRVAAASGWGE